MAPTNEECDFNCEKSVREILTVIEVQFRDHYLQYKSAVEEQKNILQQMWDLSQRYLILTRGTPCVQPYPIDVTNCEKRIITKKFNTKRHLIRASNTDLTASLSKLKGKCWAFDRALKKIDTSLPSRVVEGDKTRQPIWYYIALYNDFFKYFYEFQKMVKNLQQFLLVEDIGSVVDYRYSLESEKAVNEYFMESLQVDMS